MNILIDNKICMVLSLVSVREVLGLTIEQMAEIYGSCSVTDWRKYEANWLQLPECVIQELEKAVSQKVVEGLESLAFGLNISKLNLHVV
jgi:Domain of unknown function (DUF1870)